LSGFHALQLALAGFAAAAVALALRRAPHEEVEALASRVYLLRGLGRIALPLAFVGIIVDLGRALEGAAGLGIGSADGQRALARSLVGLSIGACTAVASLGVAASLRRRVRARRRAPEPTGPALDRARGGV
jgi:hypothetical protein